MVVFKLDFGRVGGEGEKVKDVIIFYVIDEGIFSRIFFNW